MSGPPALADPGANPRVRALLAALATMAVLATACDNGDPYVAPSQAPSTESVQPVVASDTLEAFERAVRRGAAARATALGADDDAGAFLGAVAANAGDLRLGAVGFNYLGET